MSFLAQINKTNYLNPEALKEELKAGRKVSLDTHVYTLKTTAEKTLIAVPDKTDKQQLSLPISLVIKRMSEGQGFILPLTA